MVDQLLGYFRFPNSSVPTTSSIKCFWPLLGPEAPFWELTGTTSGTESGRPTARADALPLCECRMAGARSIDARFFWGDFPCTDLWPTLSNFEFLPPCHLSVAFLPFTVREHAGTATKVATLKFPGSAA